MFQDDGYPPSKTPDYEQVDQQNSRASGLELWGGHECTVNRVGDRWFDQTPRTGHEDRIGDLDLFADLGITSLRYPALWERISPEAPDASDFRWTDARLPRIRALGMNPILTLCHHGSGPRWTSLVHEGFAPGLARHAAAVARRYPWVRDWTPVNEPLTTARFSALYGYWYPHTKSEAAFWLALLNEIDATRFAMREIRRLNPAARLIQTDDLGHCHATSPLRAEADYQNERRWIGWDLLSGRVVPGHALWGRLIRFGLEERLRAIADDPCPPDVIGVNHYLASERLLDHRIGRHAARALADRELGRHDGVAYVDVDAIQSLRTGLVGLPALLRQAAERYGRPVAVTECHNGATREEQVRWFVGVWRDVEGLRREGVDVRAVTAWSLLGSHDWNRMVTRFVGHYEVGVFDVRSGQPRPTALAGVLRDLARGRTPQAPGLDEPGWWHRPSRFRNAPPPPRDAYKRTTRHDPQEAPGSRPATGTSSAPLLIVGPGGTTLARLVERACEVRALRHVRLPAAALTEQGLRALAPWAVLDARDWAGVCEEPLLTEATLRWDGALPSGADFTPPEALAALCGRVGVPLAVLTAASGFEEADARLLVLGRGSVLLARTDRVFPPWDRARFAVRTLDVLDAGLPVEVDAGAPWDGVYGPDAVDAILDLLTDGVRGPVPLLPGETCSLATFARRLAETADCPLDLVVEREGGRRLSLAATGATYLPPNETTLERFVRESRCARRLDDVAVARRLDEPHEGPPNHVRTTADRDHGAAEHAP